jgi:hypothetical protein
VKDHFYMMHEQIEDQEIIERYARNQLEPAERKAFEEHYFSCDECFEKLQATERFIAGVRDAARRAVLPKSAPASAPAWRIAPLWSPTFGIGVIAALLLAIAGGSWYHAQVSHLRGQLSTSDAALQREQQAHAAVEQQLQQALQAEANVPLVMLQSTRDAQAQPLEALLPAGATHLVLWTEVPAGRFTSYRLEIYGAEERPIATLTHLTRNAYGALAASIPAQQLQPGEFRIKLYGEEPLPASLLAEYKLRIRRP